MSTFESFCQRLDAVAGDLSRLTGQALLAASRTQLAALREMPKTGLTAQQLADLSIKACRIGLHTECLPDAMLLFAPARPLDNTAARRSMQDYETLLNYRTEQTNYVTCRRVYRGWAFSKS